MALNLIYGRAGTGKTMLCLEKIKSDGGTSIIIVPEQTSLSMELLAVEKLGYLGKDCNVLSFNRLFHSLYKQENGKKREYISSIGKTLVINRLLAENSEKLTVFKNAQKYAIASGQILSTFSEFKRHSIEPATVEKAGSVLTGKAALKFSDLSLLYKEYVKEIGKFGCDSEDNLSLLSEMIYKNEELKATTIFIDGFSSFTSVEMSVIKALIENTRNVFITLTLSDDNSFLFEPIAASAEKLKSLVSSDLLGKDTVLKGNKKHTDGLKFLERNYYSFSNEVYDKDVTDIEIFTADTPYSECDMCAWEIYNLVKNNGYRFGDIAVLSSNPAVYDGIIADTFKRYDIDYYTDSKISVSSHPLSAFFVNLCNMCISNFASDDVINLLKSGFFGLEADEIAIFENYLIHTGIKGRQWQSGDDWSYFSDKYDIEKINCIKNKISEIVLPFKNRLNGGKTAGEFCSAIEELCEKIQLSQKVEKISSKLFKEGELQRSATFGAVLNVIYDCLKQFKICMGNTKITLTKFKDMLCAMLSQSKTGSIPVSSDRVITGGFTDSRLSKIKVLFILGATAGSFPPAISGTGIITDTERRIFERNNILLAPDNRKKAMEQPFKMYSVITVPSEKLIISYPNISESGKANEKAEIIEDLTKMFPSVNIKSASQRSLESLITTPEAAVFAFADKGESAEKESLMAWFEGKHGKYNAFNRILSAKYYRLSDTISKETANILYRGKINATVSRLEQFAKCPYSFFVKYGLSLNEKQTSGYEVTDAGTFMHRILECFTSHILENKINWEQITKEESDRIASISAQTAIDKLTGKFPLMDKRMTFFVNRMKNAGIETAWTIVRHIQSGKMRPVATEYKLKDNGVPFEVTTPDGNKLTLYGTIDRVDCYGDSFRIIDYKSSKKTLDLCKVYEGSMLQLLLYSAAMRNKSGEATGMFYLTLAVPEIDYKKAGTTEELEKAMYNERKMNGFMVGDEKVAEIMDENFHKSEVINVDYKKDVLSGNVLSKEEYLLLEKRAVKNATDFGDRILGGEISPSPCLTGMGSSCTYCSFSPICGFEQNSGNFRKPLNLKKDEIIQLLKEAETNEQ
ncbi:MAG: PD-(D/E)XK nuclease family protein [Clostridia bacterium]|nr:PD-(D/E)XK nuclease family protein [Clostridia bacterium]